MKTFIFKGNSDGNFSEINEEKTAYSCVEFDGPVKYVLGNPNGQGVIITGSHTSHLGNGEGWMIGAEIACVDAGLDDWEFILKPAQNQLIVIAPDETAMARNNLERRRGSNTV